MTVRRVVTGHDSEGRSRVVDDQNVEPITSALTPGFAAYRLWGHDEPFAKYYGQPTEENCARALRLGHKVYVAEGCWHCHSQFVRPVANEERRWGPVAKSVEYQNELQRPVLFGTRQTDALA